jgi:hypothetical protein
MNAARWGTIGHVQRHGYQLLGYAVWKGGTWYLRRRYGGAPRKLAAGALAALVLAALVLVQRRAFNGD